MTNQTEKTERITVVDQEVGRFHVTLDGKIRVAGTSPIGPAIVSVRIEQVREVDGKVFRSNAIFMLDGRHQWSTPAQFMNGDVVGFVGRHHRNVVPIDLEVAHVETLRVNDFEGPLSFGGPRPTQLPSPEVAAEAARLAELREQTDREIAELVAEIEAREILCDDEPEPSECHHPRGERIVRMFERPFTGTGAELVCSWCGTSLRSLRLTRRDDLVPGDVIVSSPIQRRRVALEPFWVVERHVEGADGERSLWVWRDHPDGLTERTLLPAPDSLVVPVLEDVHEREVARTKERNLRVVRSIAGRISQNGPVVGPRAFDLNFDGLYRDFLSGGGHDFRLGSGAFELQLERELRALGWSEVSGDLRSEQDVRTARSHAGIRS